MFMCVFFFKQKTAYEMRISDWSSDVCSSDLVNVVASGFAFYSITLAARPKDRNHPYGHGKVEFFSVFLEGGLIFIAGVLIVVKAGYNIFFSETVGNLMSGMELIAFTGVATIVFGTYMVLQSHALNTLTTQADGKHLQHK